MSSLPPAPSWPAKEGKDEWRRAAPALKERRTITKADLPHMVSSTVNAVHRHLVKEPSATSPHPVLKAYCLAAGTERPAQITIDTEDDHITTCKRDKRRHPAFQTMFQALAGSRRLAVELGLTSTSPNKTAATETDDDLADLDLTSSTRRTTGAADRTATACPTSAGPKRG